MVKFLENNKTWCGIPDEAIKTAKANHEKTAKFRTAVCSDAPAAHPKSAAAQRRHHHALASTAPSNTKTGRGTFDTLNGNPLAK